MFGTRSLRLTSAVTLFFFAWTILSPAFAVALPKDTAPAQAEERNLLDELRDTALQARAKAGKGRSHETEAKRLMDREAGLDTEQAQAEAEFAEVGKRLDDKNLPEEIKARHREAVAAYRAGMGQLRQHLRAVREARGRKDKQGEQQALDGLAGFLEQGQKRRPHQPLDPKNLPFRAPDEKPRPAREKKEDIEPLLHSAKPVQVAATDLVPGLLAQATPVVPGPAPTPDDLAETEDVQITQAIKDQATALHHNPVEIWNWVRNSVEFLPTYGSIQGSDLTLQTKRGNAFDTASLLIALLRASGIPARYVYGTIQVPAEQVMNWVGGVKTPEAAQSLLGQGGIPTTALVSGGKITAFKLEHVWVSAFVDYVPSRGAVNNVGDTWVPLDGSFKQYDYTQGMDIKTAVPFDTKGFVDRVKQTATVNDAEGWVQNVDQNVVQTLMTDYQGRVHSFINSQNPDATVGDVIGTKTIAAHDYPFLMGGLPYQTVSAGNPSSVLTDKVRLKLRVNLYASNQDRALDSPMMSYGANLSSLAGKRISFAYDPASPADQAVIDNANAHYQTRLPAYLIHVQPTLKIEGETVASGGAYTMGENHILSVEVVAPWYSHDRDYRVTSGDFYALGLNLSGITPEAFDARTKQQDLRVTMGPDSGNYTAEMFHQIALGWWAEKYAFNDIIGAENKVVQYQLPSHVLAGSPLAVRYFFGIARSANYGSRVMDAKEDFIMAVHVAGDREQKRRFALAAGYVGSYLEAGIFDQAFLMDPGHSMSTITALKAASDQGVAIYTIDASNATMLGRIATDPGDLQTMRDAVAAGLRVTTAQRDITVDSFTGLGYILEDPRTGGAAYLISGGRNGGNAPAGQTIYPLPQMPAMPVIGIMAGSVLRGAGATLVAEGGVITGLVLPELAGAGGAGAVAGGVVVGGAAAAAAILMAVIVILMISTAVMQAVDAKYPRVNRRFRHYTSAASAIVASSMILETQSDGTFGSGVYVTDAVEEESFGIGCPPDSLNVATRLQIPRPDKIDPSRITGWVEITITRDGYYVIDSQVNSSGQTEFIIREPLVPTIHPYYKTATRALYIGPYAFALNISDVCF